MRVDIVTKEYPPEIYGGAGVHATELVKALRDMIDVRVRAFGADRDEEGTTSYGVPAELAAANAAVQTLGTDLEIVSDVAGADVVHSHTWYANFAGHLASLLHGIPHIVTAHSLEPLRPWKAEQLGGGYAVSSWIEKTSYEGAAAIVAVSGGMRADILRSYPALDPDRVHVIYNGIDVEAWHPVEDPALLEELGIDPAKPSVVFVGRITRQKGLPYFLRAAERLPADVQVILAAGAPDTPQIMAEVEGLVRGLQQSRDGVVWLDRMLSRHELCTILSAATTFVCPSVYEPLGIVNLEAMACGAAVVGTATGGIPEVVVDGVTGRLVPIDQVQDGTGTPTDPERFVSDLAQDARCVGGARAQDELDVGRQVGSGAQEQREALLARDPADEDDGRAIRVDAERATAVGVDRGAGAVLDLVDRHEPPGLAVDDDLGDAAGGGGDDGELARHRLEVHDAERLVDRRADEGGRSGQYRGELGAWQVPVDPDHPVAVGAELLDEGGDLGHDLLGLRRAGAEHELHFGREEPSRAQQVGQALLAGDPADEHD